MDMIAIFSSLVGAVLGIRFRVYVLIPAMMLGFVIVAVIGGLKGAAISWYPISAAVCAVSLQLGYLGGIVTRYCLALARVRSQRALRSTVARN